MISFGCNRPDTFFTFSSMSLNGKLALITGCSGGIGQATALALAIRGCSIAVHYNTAQQPADDLVAELTKLPGIRAHAFQADMGDYDSVRAMHAAVVDILGHPDILFNNAGTTGTVVGKRGDIESVRLDDFEKTWKVNTGSSFLVSCVDLFVPSAQECHSAHPTVYPAYGIPEVWSCGFLLECSCGQVLTFPLRFLTVHASSSGIGGVIGPHYASAKSGQHGLMHWIAVRYAKDGITCNVVAPALIEDTTMMANPSEEIRNTIPIGRLGKPHEVASVVETLVTNEYLTNKIMVVDGGLTPSAF
ncbi:NAD-binding protein [Mycena sanguinolenta]|uniref:NAD-binding protein n=1 Tax=Mycena sanguinolenta TaxID=230812 RepID=A0A8H6YLR6_9AGAR|nr:NAD-binding protein [Mycena sanguinolenta]